MTKIVLPGAWELTQDVQRNFFTLHVPNAWRQVANNLAQQRANLQGKGYRSVPVYSLDPLIAGSFPPIIQTVRNGWQKPGVPWLFATERADLSDLPMFIKDWLREEFSRDLEDVESILARLNDEDWQWEEESKNYSLRHPQNKAEKDILYQAIPDYLAGKFLNNPTVSFGADNQYTLTFYRVISLKGAELMSWPPYPVVLTNSKGEERLDHAYISFVIRFVLHTVPWRDNPIIYHQLSVRRWNTEPLEHIPYRGVKAHIGDNRRWLDGERQPFCFIPLTIKRQGGELQWPRAISELLLTNDSRLPNPTTLASNPAYNWSAFGAMPSGIQAAIAYDSRQGEAPCLPGVSPRDFASLDQAIQEALPIQRVGEAVKVSGSVKPFWSVDKPKKKIVALRVEDQNQSTKRKRAKKSDDPNYLSTPMLRPQIAGPAVFRQTENSWSTILILWETPQCRDALIAEICQLLSLSPKGEANIYETPSGLPGEARIYEGELGSLCIKTQHVGELTQNLDIDNPSVPGRNRQQRRIHSLEERISTIVSFLPLTEGLSGALIEIRPKPFIAEADPKLAWRIGAMQAGYLNQHIHRITFTTKEGEERVKKSGLQRVKRAVSDLLRQFGILPTPLIKQKIDGIEPNVWLTCFYVLRRTKKTTASGLPNTVVLMVRVNPVKGEVEFTTPSLWKGKVSVKENPWVSSPVLLRHLLSEKWDPDSYFDETTEDISDEQQRKDREREQNLLNKFVGECLQDCLSTAIADEDEKHRRVLFMAEAQNARLKLPWLQNPTLPANDLPNELKHHITKPKEINRLWIVRLRLRGNNGEVPVGIVKDSLGSRTSGLFHWQGVCDDAERSSEARMPSGSSLYLSIRKGLNTEQETLRKWESRLDNGSRPAGNARLLEIAVVHHPGIEHNKLAHFVHNLRSRWPYFANDVSLPFPFPFATKAKEYAVSAKDTEEFLESDDSDELPSNVS